MTTLALIVLLQVPADTPPGTCTDVELAALTRAQEHVRRGDSDAGRALLETASQRCPLNELAVLALRGWAEARALAPAGGAADLQGPVTRTLEGLERLARGGEWALEVEYAVTCIRAAIAAAQDERPEMELLLIHARDLSERLLLRSRRAAWPHTYNLVAGELWFEVDRYADATAAYERAVRADPSPTALIGLARALMRLDRVQDACAASRRVTDAAPALRALAERDLSRCR